MCIVQPEDEVTWCLSKHISIFSLLPVASIRCSAKYILINRNLPTIQYDVRKIDSPTTDTDNWYELTIFYYNSCYLNQASITTFISNQLTLNDGRILAHWKDSSKEDRRY